VSYGIVCYLLALPRELFAYGPIIGTIAVPVHVRIILVYVGYNSLSKMIRIVFVGYLFNANSKHCYQCSGSESDSTGSTCFWASRIRIRSGSWIRILLSSCKKSKKNLNSYYFVTLFYFLSMENYVNLPSNSNKQKNDCFLLAS
jgi:hypothetical protein